MAIQLLSPTADHAQIVIWVKEVLKETGWTAREWSMKATSKPDTVRNILRARSLSPQIRTIQKLAEAAGAFPDWLPRQAITTATLSRSGEGISHPLSQTGRIALIGNIGAGEKVYHFGIGETQIDVPAPPGVKRGVAARVKGDSMLPVYRDGDMVIGTEHEGKVEDLVGRDCFVQVQDGPLYLKVVRRGTKGRFHLESYNDTGPIMNQVIEWAAPVAWIKRG